MLSGEFERKMGFKKIHHIARERKLGQIKFPKGNEKQDCNDMCTNFLTQQYYHSRSKFLRGQLMGCMCHAP